MYSEILQEIGLAKNEAKIYETLLKEGESSVSEIALKSKIHRRNVYDSINRLIEKGVIFQIINKKENEYKAVDPNKLLEVLDEKEKKLKKILPDLLKFYNSKPHEQEAYIYRGVEGFKNYMRDILLKKEDAYFIGAKGGWFDPHLKTFVKGFLKDAKKQNIKYKYLFDWEMKDKKQEIVKEIGGLYKFLPKEYSTNSAIDIFSDRVVTFTGLKLAKIDEDVTIFVLVSRELAESYKKWFEFMWNNCS